MAPGYQLELQQLGRRLELTGEVVLHLGAVSTSYAAAAPPLYWWGSWYGREPYAGYAHPLLLEGVQLALVQALGGSPQQR